MAPNPDPPPAPPEPTRELSPGANQGLAGDSPGPPTAAAASPPALVGDYELLGEIERGGMGIVYRARERHSGRLVALKMMRPDGADPANLRRFILEARATGELSHPGVVAIHAWGEH